MRSHQEYMREAIKEAEIAAQNGECPIGAIVVFKGDIIGRGRQGVEKDKSVSSHAEILAIKEASKSFNNWRLNGTYLYTTLEPCPMCISAAILARIEKVFFGAFDKRLGAGGSLFALADHPSLPHNPEISGGLLEKECRTLLTDFFKQIRID